MFPTLGSDSPPPAEKKEEVVVAKPEIKTEEKAWW